MGRSLQTVWRATQVQTVVRDFSYLTQPHQLQQLQQQQQQLLLLLLLFRVLRSKPAFKFAFFWRTEIRHAEGPTAGNGCPFFCMPYLAIEGTSAAAADSIRTSKNEHDLLFCSLLQLLPTMRAAALHQSNLLELQYAGGSFTVLTFRVNS